MRRVIRLSRAERRCAVSAATVGAAFEAGRDKARGRMRSHRTRFIGCADVHSIAHRVGVRLYGEDTPEAVEYANGWTHAVIIQHTEERTTCGQCSTGEGCCSV